MREVATLLMEATPGIVFDEDIVLVERYLKGDEASFGALYERYYDKVLGIARGVLLDADEALMRVRAGLKEGATHPFVIAGVQQMATGLAFILPALLEPQHATWTPRATGAVLYLAIFGGIVGYGCYMTALSRLPLPIVSIYTYVNPVVSVFLGWLVYAEPFGWREMLAMVVIFLGVWMVRRASAAADKLRADRSAQRGR